MLASWNPDQVPDDSLGQLVYRSHLLGGDRSVCNWGGGNTSTKGSATDYRGRTVDVLWVKGSGSDLATAPPAHFAALALEPLLELPERYQDMDDQAMVDYLMHAALHPGGVRPSIETLLHAFLPALHVDHTHPDAIVALCTAAEGEAWAKELYGDRAIWIPYRRPGFALARQVAEALRAHPTAEVVLLAKHGLVTWGETAASCYASTQKAIADAEHYLQKRSRPWTPPVSHRTSDERWDLYRQIAPWLRGRLGRHGRVVLSFQTSDAVLGFLGDSHCLEMAREGAACPDHLVRTGRVPLILSAEASTGWDALRTELDQSLARFEEATSAEFAACAHHNETPDPPTPRVILIPNLGIVTAGGSLLDARLTADLFDRAMSVISLLRRAGAEYRPLGAQDSFDVQYWPLERYKLTLRPREGELSHQVAFITGGAGGIGRAIARAMVRRGAHVVLADIDGAAAARVEGEICAEFGEGRAIATAMDVTKEETVAAAYGAAVAAYGGIDIIVANAGIASSQALTSTTLADWERTLSILGTGYFLTARDGARILQEQETGGSILFIASKNAVSAGRNIAAYGAAKAAELHLARCLAEELGAHGVRVNVINPDAVISGSGIWSSQWKEERARNYQISVDDLPAYYRERTILKVNIQPEDVAEAACFLVSDRASKTTGAMLPVDGGVSTAFPR